jgi:hypothetical protein
VTIPALDDGGLNLRLNRWILRDQDIAMTERIGVVAAAARAALAQGAIVAGAVVTASSRRSGCAHATDGRWGARDGSMIGE